jgi:hypothetical protein
MKTGQGSQAERIKLNKKALAIYLLSLAFLLPLFSLFALGEPDILGIDITENTIPSITVMFNEPISVSTLSYSLTDSANADITKVLSTPKFSDLYDKVYLKVEEELGVGKYTFSVSACDIVGNCAEKPDKKEFEIKMSELNITLNQPLFGVFSAKSSELIIETNREATCRYGLIDTEIKDMDGSFINDGEYMVKHKVSNFQFIFDKVYFKCKDKYGYTAKKEITFTFDNTAPVIEVKGVDVYNLPLRSKLSVHSINREVQCAFSKTAAREFNEMIGFAGFRLDDPARYSRSLEQQLYQQDLTDGAMNVFFVQCISKAGVLSNRAKVEIEVDTSKILGATIYSPKEYMGQSDFKINISTTVPAICYYTVSDEATFSGSFSPSSSAASGGGALREHISSTSEKFTEGRHTLKIRCTDETGTKTVEKKSDFMVDLTDPIIIDAGIVTLPDNPSIITIPNRINIYAKASDNQSGIMYYEYSVFKNDYSPSAITDWEIIDTQNEAINLTLYIGNLQDGSSYFVKIRVVDRSGRISEEFRTNAVTYEPTDDMPSAPLVCRDIGCNCTSNSDCNSNYCNSDNVCAEASCDDGEHNGDESDVDCGGSCSDKCGRGKMCDIDDDCDTGSCISKRCGEKNHCTDGIKSGDETDVDCGGSRCTPCGLGKECTFDSDCLSGFCQEGEISSMCFEKAEIIPEKDRPELPSMDPYTPPEPVYQEKQSSLLFYILSILFILLGILGGYYIYYSKNNYVPDNKLGKAGGAKGNIAQSNTGANKLRQSGNASLQGASNQQRAQQYTGAQYKQTGGAGQQRGQTTAQNKYLPNAATYRTSKSQTPAASAASRGVASKNEEGDNLDYLKKLLKPKSTMDKLADIGKKERDINDILAKKSKKPKDDKTKKAKE